MSIDTLFENVSIDTLFEGCMSLFLLYQTVTLVSE